MTDTAALAQVIANIRTNADSIRKAIRTTSYLPGHRDDCIYVWPEHWLAVKFNDDGCRAVAADLATIVKPDSKLVFTNGNRQKAVLMNRDMALQAALEHTLKILASFEKLAA